jgi:hypothetical protein
MMEMMTEMQLTNWWTFVLAMVGFGVLQGYILEAKIFKELI